jgi:hypothetical protein
MALLRRRYGGKIDDEKVTRFSFSELLSRTRGCWISSRPAPVRIWGKRAVTDHQAMAGRVAPLGVLGHKVGDLGLDGGM